jgi:hypothetical protein
MSEYILKVIAVVFWSAIKYIVGFFMALGMGFNFIETLIYNVGGGMLGVVVYLYLWDFIFQLRMKYFPPKPITGIKMSKWRRFLIKVIKKYELMGIVILTPIILTPPIGTIIAITLEKNKWKIKRMMFLSFLGWTLFLYGIYALFGVRLDEVIGKLF